MKGLGFAFSFFLRTCIARTNLRCGACLFLFWFRILSEFIAQQSTVRRLTARFLRIQDIRIVLEGVAVKDNLVDPIAAKALSIPRKL